MQVAPVYSNPRLDCHWAYQRLSSAHQTHIRHTHCIEPHRLPCGALSLRGVFQGASFSSHSSHKTFIRTPSVLGRLLHPVWLCECYPLATGRTPQAAPTQKIMANKLGQLALSCQALSLSLSCCTLGRSLSRCFWSSYSSLRTLFKLQNDTDCWGGLAFRISEHLLVAESRLVEKPVECSVWIAGDKFGIQTLDKFTLHTSDGVKGICLASIDRKSSSQ